MLVSVRLVKIVQCLVVLPCLDLNWELSLRPFSVKFV